jgi:ATP phosphoribosyltransferase
VCPTTASWKASGPRKERPRRGTAEIIVDITTTGATLAANALKILDDGVILRSEANLVASVGAAWGERARAAARTVLGRIAAEEEARSTREVRAAMRADSSVDLSDLASRFEARAPYGRNGTELVLRCPAAHAHGLVDALLAAGAQEISMRGFEALFRPTNPLIEKLEARLAA